jgi:hypothetical protein
MQHFIEVQVAAADKLYELMMNDHKERVQDMQLWADMNTSLIKKLEDRDKEIERLRAEITALRAGEAL